MPRRRGPRKRKTRPAAQSRARKGLTGGGRLQRRRPADGCSERGAEAQVAPGLEAQARRNERGEADAEEKATVRGLVAVAGVCAHREQRAREGAAGGGLITDDERYEQVVDVWKKTTQTISDQMVEALDPKGAVTMMTTSGARGNKGNIGQLGGMRGLMADPSGRIIEVPVRSNFR